jgi:uncharacterized protein YcfJ
MKTNTLNLVKHGRFTLAAALLAVAVTGCYNPDGTQNNTASGALAGGAFGAATGAIIGGRHNAGEGALIGAAAGSVLGAIIGNSADQQQAAARLREQNRETYLRAQQGTPLSVADVKALSKAGLADDTIIAQINNSHTVYHLSNPDLIDLQSAGVSQRIITYMINTASAINPAATAVAVASAPPPPPVEVMTPMPGPGYVWTNGEWVWNGGWYWSAGYWALPPYPGAIWIGGYWGPGPHGYIRYGGHWGTRR